MSRKRALSDEERTLWDTVTRAVKPLRRRRVKAEEVETPAPATLKAAPKAAKQSPVKGPAPKPAAPRSAPPPLAPIDRKLKQKLGRGTKAIDARIDLHGMTQADAHAALSHFLRRAQRDGASVVLVITGKGAVASDPYAERGVLKRQVPHWLESGEMRSFVVGFESAGIGHGGAGALYVRVRKAR
jgi:DNA-nicking Smr family endonuclease